MAATTHTTVFPNEIWICISKGLCFRDLISLSLCCKSFHEDFQDHLQEIREPLKEKYRYYSPNKERTIYGSRGYYRAVPGQHLVFHRLLLDVLGGRIPPNYIEELEVDELIAASDYNSKVMERLRELRDHDQASPIEPCFFPGYKRLIHNEVETSPWIPKTEQKTLLRNLFHGCEDTALSLVLPRLTNLRLLRIPHGITATAHVIERIARAAAADPAATSPLSELSALALIAHFHNADWYSHTVPYFMLPSMQTVFYHGLCMSDNHVWSRKPLMADVAPRCPASAVWLRDSWVSIANLPKLADLFRGPCVLHNHVYVNKDPEYDEWYATFSKDKQWCRYVVDVQLDGDGRPVPGTRTERIELAEDGYDWDGKPEGGFGHFEIK